MLTMKTARQNENSSMKNGIQTMERAGFSLIELSIVLSIVGIITGAIWFGITAVNQHNITTQAEQELAIVKNGVIAKANGNPFPAAVQGVITPSLITLGIIPQWAVVDANGAKPPWNISGLPSIGNGDGLSVWTGVNGNHKSFRVSFYYPPNYACIDLLLKATSCNVGTVGCPIGVMTNGAQTYQLPDPNTGWQIMNVGLASTLCNANPALPNPESVEFDYSL